MADCLPPYECPPRKMRPLAMPRKTSAAAAIPSRSLSAFAGNGGLLFRCWRNGRSYRKIIKPASSNPWASLASSGALQLEPAPCVNAKAWPFTRSGRCRKPRTPFASNGSSIPAALFFLLEQAVVLLDEVQDDVLHFQQLFPLLAVECDREPAHPVDGQRTLFADLQRHLAAGTLQRFVLRAEALEFGLEFGFSWHVFSESVRYHNRSRVLP